MSFKQAVVDSSIDAVSAGIGSYILTAFLTDAGDSQVQVPLLGSMSLAMASAVSQGALILGDDLIYQQWLQKYVPQQYRYILDTSNYLGEGLVLTALPSLAIYLSNSGKLSTSDALKLALIQAGGLALGSQISSRFAIPLADKYLI